MRERERGRERGRGETEKILAFRRLSHCVVAHIEEKVVVYSVHVIVLARLLCGRADTRPHAHVRRTQAPMNMFEYGRGACTGAESSRHHTLGKALNRTAS